MSSTHDHKVEETGQKSEEFLSKTETGQPPFGETGGPNPEVAEPEKRPIPIWLVGIIGVGIFTKKNNRPPGTSPTLKRAS
jgi:hypothetical protein